MPRKNNKVLSEIHLIPTKEDILNLVGSGRANDFYRLFYNSDNIEFEKDGKDVILSPSDVGKTVYDQHYGDGNDWYMTFNFPEFDNINVSIEGYYSSYGNAEFHAVYLSKPIEHTETRYEKI